MHLIRPTKGVHCDPSDFFPGSSYPQKDYAKSFQVIVSSSFALILRQKPWEQHLQWGQGNPSKSRCRKDHCDPAYTFQWKNAQNSLFVKGKCLQFLYFFVINLDKKHVQLCFATQFCNICSGKCQKTSILTIFVIFCYF